MKRFQEADELEFVEGAEDPGFPGANEASAVGHEASQGLADAFVRDRCGQPHLRAEAL